NEKYVFLQKVKDNRGKIKYLPCTPEQGIMDMIHDDELKHCGEINKLFNDQILDISRIIDEEDYLAIHSDKPRKKAKKQFDFIINEIVKRTGHPVEYCEKIFALHYVNQKYQDKSSLRALFSPIFQGQ